MKKFVVIALALNGLSKVFRPEDRVTESDFPAGQCPDLVKKGFLREITPEEEAADKAYAEKLEKENAEKEKANKIEELKRKAEEAKLASEKATALAEGLQKDYETALAELKASEPAETGKPKK